MARKNAPAPAPVAPPRHVSPIGAQLIALGYAPNDFILDLNRSISVPDRSALPAPWDLPSRLFKLPIEVDIGQLDRPLGLMHPLLADHPFVLEVEAALGVKIPPGGAPNDAGYTSSKGGTWWHAVDLMGNKHWKALLDTRQFTSDHHLLSAVSFALGGKDRLSISNARKVMRAVKATEPSYRATALRQFMQPQPGQGEGKGPPSWPVNDAMKLDAAGKAWARIHGIEDGWLSYGRGRYLNWTEFGRKQYDAPDRSPGVPRAAYQTSLFDLLPA